MTDIGRLLNETCIYQQRTPNHHFEDYPGAPRRSARAELELLRAEQPTSASAGAPAAIPVAAAR